MLGVVGLVTAGPLLYHRVDEEIRRRIEDRIARHYRGLKVKIRSAELVEGQGIKLRDVAIWEPAAAGPHPDLVHYDEVLLCCNTTLRDLLVCDPVVTRLIMRRPTIRATRRPDGSWSTSRLLPLPKLSEHPVEAWIEDGTIELFDPLKSPAGNLVIRSLQLRLAPVDPTQSPGWSPMARRLTGSFAADGVRNVELHGVADLDQGRFGVEGAVEGAELSPEWFAAMPEPFAAPLKNLAGVRGQCGLRFSVAADGGGKPLRFTVAGDLQRGRVEDPRLPQVLSDVALKFEASNGGFVLRDVQARCGQASLLMGYRQVGYATDSPRRLEAHVRQLEIDRRLYMALPAPLQQQWHRYRPAGNVDLDAVLDFDGQRWRPNVVARCVNTSFTYERFPFRVEDAQGRILLNDEVLKIEGLAGEGFTGYSGGQPIHLEAEIHSPFHSPYGRFSASGTALALDGKLAAALNEKAREVFLSLGAQGDADFDFNLWRDQGEASFHKHLAVKLNRCSLQFGKFPYPVHEIVGRLEMLDDTWTFHELAGRNDTGRIYCEGAMTPTLQGSELALTFRGNDVPIDEELRDALRPNEKQVWMAFRPRGAMDFTADVNYLSESKQLKVSIVALPQSDSSSIEPVHFPYKLERLSGVFRYQDGRVTLDGIQAEHGAVKVTTGGVCEFLPDGRWLFQLDRLAVDRLRFDRELTQALPERMRRAIGELHPSGPVNLSGQFALGSGQSADDPIESRWDIRVGLQQAGFHCGLPVENVSGAIRLYGGFNGRGLQTGGELDIDSMTCRGLQMTEVRGPIWIDDRQVLLGSWVARRNGAAVPAAQQSPATTTGGAMPDAPSPNGASANGAAEAPRMVSARAFGGVVSADGWVSFSPEFAYGVRANLAGADVTRVAREFGAGSQSLMGNLTAFVELRGRDRSTNGLGGHGWIQLRQADVHELPVMDALLRIVGARPAGSTAISNSDVKFRLLGEHIYFDAIDIASDTYSLSGSGEMDLQQNVDMEFHAQVGRGQSNLPLVKDLLSGASRQIMVIHVGGSLHEPQMRREAFPGVNQALQQLQAEAPTTVPPPQRW